MIKFGCAVWNSENNIQSVLIFQKTFFLIEIFCNSFKRSNRNRYGNCTGAIQKHCVKTLLHYTSINNVRNFSKLEALTLKKIALSVQFAPPVVERFCAQN